MRLPRPAAAALLLALSACRTPAAPAPPAAADRADVVRQAVERVLPSLVSVSYSIKTEERKRKFECPGIVLTAQGKILTSLYYFPEQYGPDNFVDVEVRLKPGSNEKPRQGRYVGRHEGGQVAFVEITDPLESPLAPIAFVDRPIEIGDEILCLGLISQANNQPYFTFGHATAFLEHPSPLYVVDQNTSNYGAPAMNLRGEVVGVVAPYRGGGQSAFAGVLPTRVFEEIASAPPTAEAPSRRPWLGIGDMQAISSDLAENLGLPAGRQGILVGSVMEGSPAEAAGMRSEDLIVRIEDRPFRATEGQEVEAFQSAMRRLKIGRPYSLGLWRKGKEEEAKVVLAPFPKNAEEAERHAAGGEFRFTVRSLVFFDTYERGLPRSEPGCVVHYIEEGWASAGGTGLREDDIIKYVGSREIKDLADFKKTFEEEVARKPREIVFKVLRGYLNEVVVVRVECAW